MHIFPRKKLQVVALFLSGFVCAGAGAFQAPSFDACSQHFPQSKPLSIASIAPEWKPSALCSKTFAILYSGTSKTPLLVIERVNARSLMSAATEQRTDIFFPDERLHARHRAHLDDYRSSGYDRGHMAAAANQPDAQSMMQSFSLANIVPQDPHTNRKGAWVKLEKDTRKYVRRAKADVFIFSGPLFPSKPATIGPGRVWVPTKLFKLVYDAHDGRAWAHIIDNAPDARIHKPLTYPEFVQATGWKVLPK